MDAGIEALPEIQRALLRWHRANGMTAPWRESRDPYHVMLAAVMAQQTQMSRVLPAYGRFLEAFPTLESLAAAPVADVIRAWVGIGYNRRAVLLHRAARTIVRDGWPREAGALARIDGIGPFTAAIIASFAFGRPAACVDTNVRRVLGRLAGDEAIGGRALQQLADESMVARQPARWNQALMDYGARVCTPRPKCGVCVVAAWCPSRARYAAPQLLKVAERRAAYDASPPRAARREPPYERSARHYRGRIIDALRAAPAGAALRLPALRAAIADGRPAPTPATLRSLVDALARDGLVVMRRTAGGATVSLPDG